MQIIDSHCHVSPAWYEPVESLLFQMDRYEVAKAILIQMMGQTDNTYQEDCVRRYPNRFASVVLVDTNRPDAVDTLAQLVECGASGVRFRPTTRSPGDDPLAIWRTAEQLGIAVSCSGTAPEFGAPAFAELIEALPRLPIVLEHLGAVNHPDPVSADTDLRQRVFALARFPNVLMKFHGLGEFAHRALPVSEPFPFQHPLPPFLTMAYRAFGARRLMWGSDYPPVSGREGYGNALHLPLAELTAIPEEERRLMFGETALSVFPLHRA